MGILPPKRELIQSLGSDDFFLWEYYGEGFLGKVQAWIFRSRVKVLMKFLRKLKLEPSRILDVGCGPMFISYVLVGNREGEYVGVDIMPAEKLKKYRDAMRSVGVRNVEAVRASAEAFPFRGGAFGLVLSLDVLEHLKKPREAVVEISRVIMDDGVVAVSLPLENFIQRFSRIGFILMKIFRDPILKNAKPIPVIRTPQYHYVGDVKSYAGMVKMLKHSLHMTYSKYTPIGFHRTINVNAVHLFRKEVVT